LGLLGFGLQMSITEADKAVVTEVGDVGVACDVGTVAGDTHVLFLKWVGCVVGAVEAFPVPPLACAAALLLTFMIRARLGDEVTDELVDTLR
jgi:hypothetical protein